MAVSHETAPMNATPSPVRERGVAEGRGEGRPSPTLRPSDPPTLISIHNLACAYDRTTVLQDVSLTVERGDFVGLVGPSGAGKTTLLRALLGGVPRTSGQVDVLGQTVQSARPPAGVGYVPQVETVDWHFPVTVEDVVLMGRVRRMGLLPWPSKSDRRAVHAALDRLGLAGLAGRHIRDLSGGQQQRTFLARALVAEPQILVLDEPTASVDVKTRDDILHYLVELNRDGVTIVMTTHELNAVAAHLPWVVCVNRTVVAQGSPADVFTGPILSRTFNAEMRVVPDPVTGALLVAEAGSHGPFSRGVEPLSRGVETFGSHSSTPRLLDSSTLHSANRRQATQ